MGGAAPGARIPLFLEQKNSKFTTENGELGAMNLVVFIGCFVLSLRRLCRRNFGLGFRGVLVQGSAFHRDAGDAYVQQRGRKAMHKHVGNADQ